MIAKSDVSGTVGRGDCKVPLKTQKDDKKNQSESSFL